MSASNRSKFICPKSYAQNQNSKFNFSLDLVKYCELDVHVLRMGCLRYRQIFLEISEIDPFLSAVTVAGTCLAVFRKHFLKPNLIGVIPQGGYRWRDRQSIVAVQWLAWIESLIGEKLASAVNGKEEVVLGMKVDGYHERTRTVYEFHGCFFHGCRRCFPHRPGQPHSDPTSSMQARHEATLHKTAKLRAAGYDVIEMWECDFNRESLDNVQLGEFLRDFHTDSYVTPLEPRDAFFGGRTEAIKLYHKCTGTEQLVYQDYTSLYPWCNKVGVYPVGHPKIYLENDAQMPHLDQMEGLVKCLMLPPRRLYLPVLPYRVDGKLLFPLCAVCARERVDKDCSHTDEERALAGTWVTSEIKKAVDLGYEILKVYELWQYDTTCFNKETGTGGVFAEYVNLFLKLKQEASDWPSGCVTQEQKDEYVRLYLENEGIQLRPDQISNNPGLRQIAKLCLNSLWGKMGQRPQLSKTVYVKDPEEFFKLLSDPNIEVESVLPITEELLVLKWNYIAELDVLQPNSNVVVAAYTTASARLKLYSCFEQLQRRIIYADTDSVIYSVKEGETRLPIGNYLGELTDELEKDYGPGSYISEFASGGPKNYGYEVTTPGSDDHPTSFKVKGINLNYSNDKVINFAVLKDLLGVGSGDAKECVKVVEPRAITRLKDHTVISRPQSKIYRIVYDKRRRVENFGSLPWGY